MVSDLDQLLRQASDLLGCEDVSPRCWSPILEAVYAERDDDELMITDRRETYQYLSRRDDSTYDIDPLDEATARELCQQCGVELDTSDPEMYPRIQKRLLPEDDVAVAVSAVANAVNRINDAATRPELRWPPDRGLPAPSTD